MTQLSEENEIEERNSSDEKKDSSSRFWEGFVTGIFVVLAGVLILSTVFRLFPMKNQSKNSEAQAGAEVLTSQETADKLKEVQRLIQSKYLDEVDGQEMSDFLFRGVAAGLDDPYASYYNQDELTSVQEDSEGAYYGIGATLSQSAVTGEIQVSAVYEGSPAEKGGLKEGDQLLRYEEIPLVNLELSQVISLIKESEDVFHLTVQREEQEVTLELACGQVEKNTVTYQVLEDDLGYIRITEFDTITVTQFQEAVDALMEQKVKGLVFDLRGNPGGLLSSVCNIVDYLLPEGLIVYTEDRDGNREEYKSDEKHYVNCPAAVLVNGSSASASEIFAGALQDHNAGTIIGTPTYGKGVVQNTYILSDGSAFKLTVEKYYTPGGQDIDGNGITPDIIVEESDTEGEDAPLEKALEVLRQ